MVYQDRLGTNVTKTQKEREREGAFHIMCRTTGGDWKATYGKEGYVLPGFDPSADPEGANQQGIHRGQSTYNVA